MSDLEVEVRLFAALRRYRPSAAAGPRHHPFKVTLPSGATIATLTAHLGIPEGLVNAAALNDEAAPVTTPLHNGDHVSLFPPTAGGNGKIRPQMVGKQR
ncbi:MAG: MoaD/ThiS family protein [Anaerolineae bacterium]